MNLEGQFKRFTQANQKVSEELKVGMTLASISESRDFENVFSSASWEDEPNLTMAKVKSVLMATQKRFKSPQTSQAHRARYPFTQNQKSYKQKHGRQPRNPLKGWECPRCEMDNHTIKNCSRKSFTNQKYLKHPTSTATQDSTESSDSHSDQSSSMAITK